MSVVPPSAPRQQALAREVVERCLALSRADEQRVQVELADTAHLRFARNTVSTSGLVETASVSVRSSFGGRSGTATGTQCDPASLETLVRAAEEAARLSPLDPEHVPVPGPQSYRAVPSGGGESLEARLEAMARGAERCVRDARRAGLIAAGFVRVDERVRAIGTSAGLSAVHAASEASLAETARTADGSGSGWASCAARTAGELDFAGVARVAADKALRSRGATPLEPGDLPAILEPACVAHLVRLFVGALDLRRAEEGRSAFAAPGGGTRIGEQLFPPSVDLRSDPASPEAPTLPWDEEGLPHPPTTWVDTGTLANLAVDRFWAQERRLRPLPAAPNLLMRGEDRSLDELVAGTERAVLVTNLWYIRGLDPRELAYTGLTRDGVFLVEEGEVVRPLANFRWNDSPLRVLAGVEALTRPLRVGGRGGSLRHHVVPAARVAAFGFSSVSDAV